MAAHLGRSEGAIKAMISGTSGARSFRLLNEALAVETKKAIGRLETGLSKVKYVEDKMPLGSWPFSPPIPASALGKKETTLGGMIKSFIKPPVPTVTVTVTKKPAAHRAPWTTADETYLSRMFAQGVKLEAMATSLKRTTSGVLGRLAKLNLIKFDSATNAFYTKPVLYYKYE
jgi:hypothetical protein